MTGTSSVTRNTSSGNGGGIYNSNVVTLNDSASVTHNTASGKGGGIYNHQTTGATIRYGTGWNGFVSDNLPDDIFNF
jgi:predicted outer membrane repeat protein